MGNVTMYAHLPGINELSTKLSDGAKCKKKKITKANTYEF